MTSQQPLVSIIIPVYNGSNFVKEAIDSALAQTYPNLEVIVINDGSCDDGKTEEIALSYGDKLRYFHKGNGGVSSALNFGIREMRGEYFSWLSHDDKYTETKIEKQIQRLQGGGDIAVCSERQINSESNYLSKPSDYTKEERAGVIGWQDETCTIIDKTLFSGCALLIPKTVLDDVGFFDEELRYNQDFDMWIKICLKGYSWTYHNDVGVLSRVHENQVTQTRRDLFFGDSYKLGKRMIPRLAKLSDNKYNFLYLYAKHCAKYNLTENVALCKIEAKGKKMFSFEQNVTLFFVGIYGKLRPLIRKIYYALFKKVKTQ